MVVDTLLIKFHLSLYLFLHGPQRGEYFISCRIDGNQHGLWNEIYYKLGNFGQVT